MYPSATSIVVLGSERTVDELVILLAGEKGRLVAHMDTSDNVILNETTERVSRSWHQILVISVGDHHGFRAGHLVLREMYVHF
jgi:hypothetical protein